MVGPAGDVENPWQVKVSDERGSVQQRWCYPGEMAETSKKQGNAGGTQPSSIWQKQQKVEGGWK